MEKRIPKIKAIINQSEVARRMGISPSYLNLLLSGKRKSVKRLVQIREILTAELEMINGP